MNRRNGNIVLVNYFAKKCLFLFIFQMTITFDLQKIFHSSFYIQKGLHKFWFFHNFENLKKGFEQRAKNVQIFFAAFFKSIQLLYKKLQLFQFVTNLHTLFARNFQHPIIIIEHDLKS